MNSINLLNGDCLELLKTIPNGSIDLILTDPPYGTINGLKIYEDEGIDTSWDVTLPTKEMFEECARVLRPNGALVLFSQDPYTQEIITGAIPSVPFSYRLTWKKDSFANCLLAKKAPVNYTEDICVFFKQSYDDGNHPLREYFQDRNKIAKELGINWKEVLGNGMAGHYFTNGTQFTIPTEANYRKLQKTSLFEADYEELKKIDNEFRSKYPKVFNLTPGKKHKPNILEYKKDYTGHHPTQKPVALLEDLIETYSNEGMTVLDFTMGSGSTGVACVNTGRNFIGIELDETYFETAQNRIYAATNLGDTA